MFERTLFFLFNEAHLEISFYMLTVYEKVLADLPESDLEMVAEHRKLVAETIKGQKRFIKKLKKLREQALIDGDLVDEW